MSSIMLSTSELACIYRVTSRTVLRWIHAGMPGASTDGRHFQIDPDLAAPWVAENAPRAMSRMAIEWPKTGHVEDGEPDSDSGMAKSPLRGDPRGTADLGTQETPQHIERLNRVLAGRDDALHAANVQLTTVR